VGAGGNARLLPFPPGHGGTVIPTLALQPTDRLLVLTPHPDDESVATGGLLQHALATGARMLVVFFTDGDNNPWAQRASELRWRIGAVDRARFGVRRRGEAGRALERLGVGPSSVRFLGFPDQSATDLLVRADEAALRALTGTLGEFRPTVVVGPSLLDLHPDHSALAVLLTLALDGLGGADAPRTHVRYLVHNPRLLHRQECSLVLHLSDEQRARKRAAIGCHRTQLVLRSSWLLSFATREERFYLAESPTGIAEHPVGAALRTGESLRIPLASHTRVRAFGARTLCLVAQAPSSPVRLAMDVPSRGGAVPIRDLRSGTVVAEASFRGEGGTGDVQLPAALIPADVRLFAKVERRRGFFDEAGWKELPGVSAGS
jgi:LmbE family N-acetylglucosaminyl deacetylase